MFLILRIYIFKPFYNPIIRYFFLFKIICFVIKTTILFYLILYYP